MTGELSQSAEVAINPTSKALTARYAIVTPARDEGKNIGATIQAVIAQTVRPQQWIIVDDGSSDDTRSIAEQYARQFPWITVLPRADRGCRKNGGGVIEAFNDGYTHVVNLPWDFIVKLDGDLTFPANYFEQCLQEFIDDSSLGIGAGALYNVTPQGHQFEPHPWFHVRGATKIYRRECWEQIGGLWPGAGWDTIDEVKANMVGWRTRTFPAIPAYHHRMTGAADGGWRNNVKNGRGNYAAGYHPLYALARCVRQSFVKPYLIGGLGMLYGFIAAYWQRMKRIDDPQLIRYIRRQQMSRLLGRPTIWT
jgi:glycosyltransferase involved in cell wall biosynthesis